MAPEMQSTYQPMRQRLGTIPQFGQTTARLLMLFAQSGHGAILGGAKAARGAGLGEAATTNNIVSIPQFGHGMVAPALSESNSMF